MADVVTSPDFRGRGLARACVSALLTSFADGTTVTTVRPAATSDGEAPYRGLGFTEPRDLVLQVRVTRWSSCPGRLRTVTRRTADRCPDAAPAETWRQVRAPAALARQASCHCVGAGGLRYMPMRRP
ncbi:hypothetical protein [Streptomyces sp. NPDC001056]